MMPAKIALFSLALAGAASAAPVGTVVLDFKQSSGAFPFEAPAEWGKNYSMGVPSGGHSKCSNGAYHLRCGTILKLEPPDAQHATWRRKLLYAFLPQPDGSGPMGSPVGDGQGNFFVTTIDGGTTGAGTLVELSPPTAGATAWTEQVIHNFDTNQDGAAPFARPHRDAAGNLFVTLTGGGQNLYGTLVEFSPPAAGMTAWTETVIHSFPATDSDGYVPESSIRTDSQGNLYFTTGAGGPGQGGTVVEFSPPTGGGTAWTETILYGFKAFTSDAAGPVSGVITDAQGNLYGTTEAGGTSNNGAIYRLSPPSGGGTTWTETVLYSFSGNADGASPQRGIVMDTAGNLFVTAPFGGDANCQCGTLIELSPPQSGQGAWTETTLYQFPGGTGGAYPGAISVDDSGNLLIPTSGGGAYGVGTLMQFSNTGYVVRK